MDFGHFWLRRVLRMVIPHKTTFFGILRTSLSFRGFTSHMASKGFEDKNGITRGSLTAVLKILTKFAFKRPEIDLEILSVYDILRNVGLFKKSFLAGFRSIHAMK